MVMIVTVMLFHKLRPIRRRSLLRSTQGHHQREHKRSEVANKEKKGIKWERARSGRGHRGASTSAMAARPANPPKCRPPTTGTPMSGSNTPTTSPRAGSASAALPCIPLDPTSIDAENRKISQFSFLQIRWNCLAFRYA